MLQTTRLSESAVAALRFEIKGWRQKTTQRDYPPTASWPPLGLWSRSLAQRRNTASQRKGSSNERKSCGPSGNGLSGSVTLLRIRISRTRRENCYVVSLQVDEWKSHRRTQQPIVSWRTLGSCTLSRRSSVASPTASPTGAGSSGSNSRESIVQWRQRHRVLPCLPPVPALLHLPAKLCARSLIGSAVSAA